MRALGARHKDYGVKIDQYAPLGSALIWMFQHTLGDRFTPEMEEAWLEVYAFLSLEGGARFSGSGAYRYQSPWPVTGLAHETGPKCRED
jgi:hypothetical protein